MVHTLVVVGARGRMGVETVDIILNDNTAKLMGIIEREEHPDLGKPYGHLILQSDISKITEHINCIIDFSSPASSKETVKFALTKAVPVVIGTTGFTDQDMVFFKEAAKQIPLLMAPNMSIGVNCLYLLVKMANDLLGQDYHKEIIEVHHVNKVDAPSGTALHLADILAPSEKNNNVFTYGRHGHVGQRPQAEIGIHSVRGGDITGEHTVLFLGKNERIEIIHKAGSRRIFAEGAVKAAHWLSHAKNGLYSMQDTLRIMS